MPPQNEQLTKRKPAVLPLRWVQKTAGMKAACQRVQLPIHDRKVVNSLRLCAIMAGFWSLGRR